MKPRLQDLYNYTLRNDWANPQAGIVETLAPEQKEKQIQARIKKMRNLFAFTRKSPTQGDNFRSLLRELKATNLESALFENTTDELKQIYHLQTKENIRTMFEEFDNAHQYFTEEKTPDSIIAKFTDFFIICKIVGDFIEHNNNEANDTVAYFHAYKLLVIFGDQVEPQKLFQSIDNYLQLHNFLKLNHPLHDALIGSIPKNSPDKKIQYLSQWRNLITKTGPKGFQLFNRAIEIDNELIKRVASPSERINTLSDYKTAIHFAQSISFKNASQYEALAEIFLHYNLAENIFEKALTVDQKRKNADTLPDIIIDGKKVNYPGYYLVKLPHDAANSNSKYRALAYVLGHITNCCQSIGGHSEQCVIDGITYENNGFLLLLKSYKPIAESTTPVSAKFLIDRCKIVGQGYFWRSFYNNLTIDSWENLSTADDNIAAKILTYYAEQVVMDKSHQCLRMTIGTGGKTPDNKFGPITSYDDTMMQGTQYGDSHTQYLIFVDEKQQNELHNDIQQTLHTIFHAELSDTQNESALTVKQKLVEFLELFFNKNNIISPLQIQNMKTLLQEAEFRTYLLEAETLQSLSALKNNSSLLFEILLFLQQRKLLNKQNIKEVISAIHPYVGGYEWTRQTNIKAFFPVLRKMDQYNILDNSLIQIISESAYSLRGKSVSLSYLLNNDLIFDFVYLITKEKMSLESGIAKLQHLVKKGFNIDCRDDNSWTPLIFLYMYFDIEYINIELIKALIDLGTNLNAQTDKGETVLHAALENKASPEMIHLLLKHGANPNIVAKSGKSPLSMTTTNLIYLHPNSGRPNYNYLPHLQAMLEHKADPSLPEPKTLSTPLHTLCVVRMCNEKAYLDGIQSLLNHKANVDAQNAQGETPLHIAYKFGHEKIVTMLLAHGANPNIKNQQNGLYDDLSLTYFTDEDLKLLEKNCEYAMALIANDCRHGIFAESVLISPLTHNIALEIQALLTQDKFRPLSKELIALANQSDWLAKLVSYRLRYSDKFLSIIEHLINHGVQIKPHLLKVVCELDDDRPQPINIYLLKKCLSSSPLDLDQRDYHSNAIIHLIIKSKHESRLEALKLILEAKADPDLPFSPHRYSSYAKDKYTYPIHLTLARFPLTDIDSEVVKLLVQYKADVNKQDYKLDTPLHLAYRMEDKNLINFFLENDANPNLKNKLGILPPDTKLQDDEEFFTLVQDDICYEFGACLFWKDIITEIPTFSDAALLKSALLHEQMKLFCNSQDGWPWRLHYAASFTKNNWFIWNSIIILYKTNLLTFDNLKLIFTGVFTLKTNNNSDYKVLDKLMGFHEIFHRALDNNLSRLFQSKQLNDETFRALIPELLSKFSASDALNKLNQLHKTSILAELTGLNPTSKLDFINLQKLLDAKANPTTAVTKEGNTLLHLAIAKTKASEDQELIVKNLIALDMDVNAQNADGQTPLHCAYQYGHDKLAVLLLERGAKPLVPPVLVAETPTEPANPVVTAPEQEQKDQPQTSKQTIEAKPSSNPSALFASSRIEPPPTEPAPVKQCCVIL